MWCTFCLIILVLLTSNGVLCAWNFTDSLSNIVPFIPAVNIGPEDAYLNIHELAEKYGYTFESHTVTTEDGYILTLHRIPHGRSRESNGKVVFLMHGLADSSDSWMLQGPNDALAYILADEGYDVWMGNARGNLHSHKHNSLNANMSKFWMFSWEEIGLYDLPAMIDYTLNVTGQKSLYYVGYSQGTTTFFVLVSMKPEYNSKIKLMFGLAPEVFMSNAKSPLLNLLSPSHETIQYVLSFFNMYSPSEDLFSKIAPFVCNILVNSCDNFFYTVLGPNNVNDKMWPIILGHSPSGASTFQYVHYGQLVQSETFSRYDYGKMINRRKYGQDHPPDYELNNVTCPVILFYGGNDWFSAKIDVEKLITILPNVRQTHFIGKFGHSDYVYADDAKSLVYANIVKHLKGDPEEVMIQKPVFRYVINE